MLTSLKKIVGILVETVACVLSLYCLWFMINNKGHIVIENTTDVIGWSIIFLSLFDLLLSVVVAIKKLIGVFRFLRDSINVKFDTFCIDHLKRKEKSI